MNSTYRGDNEIPIEEFENDFNGKSKDWHDEFIKMFPDSVLSDEEYEARCKRVREIVEDQQNKGNEPISPPDNKNNE